MRIFKNKNRNKNKSTLLSIYNSKHSLDPRVIGELNLLQDKIKTYNYMIEQCRKRERELDELIKEQKKNNRKCKKAVEKVLS